MFVQDFILNGEPSGDVAGQMAACRYDPGLMRPYFDHRYRRCVTVNTGRLDKDLNPIFEKRGIDELMAQGVYSPVFNATALRKDEWLQMDRQLLKVARERLRAWADLMAVSQFGGFNAMSKMVLEHETMSDPGVAVVDMDGITEGKHDAPVFQLEGLPLPITHSDFFFSQRRLAVSRNTGTPLDMTQGEAAARRVAEMIEKTLIGVETGITYGSATAYGNNPTVYGYTTHPDRITKTDVTIPTGSNPHETLADVLAMIKLLDDANFHGPFMLYHSPDWSQWMDNDYFNTTTSGAVAPTQTLRERLRKIQAIRDVRQLDFLTSTLTLILVQMTSGTARAINGMDITTVQWESKGGMQLNFKVMAIQVPQIRSDYNGNCGICQGTTS